MCVYCGKRLHPILHDEPEGWQRGLKWGERGALWLASGSLHSWILNLQCFFSLVLSSVRLLNEISGGGGGGDCLRLLFFY